MRKVFFFLGLVSFFLSCNNDQQQPVVAGSKDSASTLAPTDLPYKASYSSSWSNDVSDTDLKMILTSYKDWADNNMTGLENSLADSVEVDFSSGENYKGPKADLIKKVGYLS